VKDLVTGAREVGGLFLKLLQMLVVPLIVTSLVSAVGGMGSLRALGRIGWRTLGWYIGTSFLAILTGLFLVNLIDPGVGVDLATLAAGAEPFKPATELAEGGPLAVLWQQVTGLVPKNPLAAAANGDILPLIFFSLLLGIFINAVEHGSADDAGREKGVLLRRFFEALAEVFMRMTMWVIGLAPLGVFAFLFVTAAGSGLAAFEALGLYALTVALGLAIHAGFTLPMLLRLFGRRSPRAWYAAVSPALVTAFSTASSNATLPLTMDCVTQRGGVRPRTGAFVLPLGATINMDGTALYEAVAVLFIAQLHGVELGFGEQAIVAFTALLASIGAAGIPHAGTVMMVIVLAAVGLPTTAVGLILAVDRVLDMGRTTVNVLSDTVVAAIVDAGEDLEPPSGEDGRGAEG
jgi:Na+/H+-dicarboxylate symporter